MAVAGGLLLLVEHRRLDRRDFPLETALVPGPLGAYLRLEPERIDVVTRDAASLGDPLGGLELVGQVDVPRCGAPVALRTRVSTQPHPAHRLDAAGDADVDGADGDQPGDQVVGLLPTA